MEVHCKTCKQAYDLGEKAAIAHKQQDYGRIAHFNRQRDLLRFYCDKAQAYFDTEFKDEMVGFSRVG